MSVRMSLWRQRIAMQQIRTESESTDNPYIQPLTNKDYVAAEGVLLRLAAAFMFLGYLLQHSSMKLLSDKWMSDNFLWFLPLFVVVVSAVVYRGFVREHIEAKAGFRWAVLSFYSITAPIILICCVFSGLNTLGMLTWFFSYDASGAATCSTLLLLAPISNLWLVRLTLKGQIENPLSMGLLNGLSLGTALIVCLLLMPVATTAIVGYVTHPFGPGPLETALLFLGIALLMSPYFLLYLTCLNCQTIWNLRESTHGMQASVFACVGLVLSIALLVCPGVSTIVKNTATVKAAMQCPDASSAVRFLRAFDCTNELLQRAYFANIPKVEFAPLLYEMITHDSSVSRAPTPEMARKAIYRITGKHFNTFKKPTVATLPESLWWLNSSFDRDQAATEVAGIIPDLKMVTSDMKCFSYKDALASRVEWTITFHNNSHSQPAEARALILLPPNAVASGLTLFIDGKPREAVFGNRGVVRSAYTNIVSQRRDPALLSWAGNDRVLLQCFPVNANSSMKVTLQVAAPFIVSDQTHAKVMLPRVIEANCPVAQQHRVQYRLLNSGVTEGGFDKTIENTALTDPVFAIDNVTGSSVLIADPMQGNSVFSQTIQPKHETLKRLVLVVDCGVRTQNQIDSLCDAVANLPDSVLVEVLYATDEFTMDKPLRANNNRELAEIMRANHPRCLGGPDNLPALHQGIIEVQGVPNATVVWVHGPQPVIFATDYALSEVFKLHDREHIYEIDMAEGPNKISQTVGTSLFDRSIQVRILRGTGSFDKSISDILLSLVGQKSSYSIVRLPSSGQATGIQLNAQLTASALLANDSARNLYAKGDISKASDLSRKHRIVTPSTSAVVLEFDRQYTEAALDEKGQTNPYSAETPAQDVSLTNPFSSVTSQLNNLSCAAAAAGPPAGSSLSYSLAKADPYAGSSGSSSSGASRHGTHLFEMFVWILVSVVGIIILAILVKTGKGATSN